MRRPRFRSPRKPRSLRREDKAVAAMLAVAQDSELDCGATSVAPGTERTCALSRELKPASEMIRFVLDPAGEVVPDVKRKLPGRGIWITASRAAIEDADQTKRFCPRFQTGRAGRRGSRHTDGSIDRTCGHRRIGYSRQGRHRDQRLLPGSRRRLAGTTSGHYFTPLMRETRASASWMPPCAVRQPENRRKSW